MSSPEVRSIPPPLWTLTLQTPTKTKLSPPGDGWIPFKNKTAHAFAADFNRPSTQVRECRSTRRPAWRRARALRQPVPTTVGQTCLRSRDQLSRVKYRIKRSRLLLVRRKPPQQQYEGAAEVAAAPAPAPAKAPLVPSTAAAVAATAPAAALTAAPPVPSTAATAPDPP